jgi:hypothetical protein
VYTPSINNSSQVPCSSREKTNHESQLSLPSPGRPDHCVCACLSEHTQCNTPQPLAAEVPPAQRVLVRPQADATVNANNDSVSNVYDVAAIQQRRSRSTLVIAIILTYPLVDFATSETRSPRRESSHPGRMAIGHLFVAVFITPIDLRPKPPLTSVALTLAR